MKTELDHRLSLLQVTSKQTACMELMLRVRNACIGLDNIDWAFTTGKIFGEYLKELGEEERKLNAEGEEYDKAQEALLKDEDLPF
jgi:hypothetical protein